MSHDALGPFFESYCRLRPVTATFTGVHDHDDRLPDWSPDGLEAAVAEMRALRRGLADESGSASAGPRALAPTGALGAETPSWPARSIDIQLADSFLEIQIAELNGPHFQRGNPALFTGEAIFGIIALMNREFAPFAARLESLTARLRGIPGFLEQARRSIAAEIPAEWTARALRECGGARTLLSFGLDLWLAHESARAAVEGAGAGFDPLRGARMAAAMCTCKATPEVQAARDAARDALAAFGRLETWLRKTIRPAAASRYSCGGEHLELLLRRGHWTPQPAAALLAEARAAFEVQSARFSEAARREAPGGWPDIQGRLADNHPDVPSYLGAHDEWWRKCREMAAAHDLVTWPDAPIRFVPIPVWTREAAPSLYYLFYRSPAPFDPPAVHECTVPAIDTMMPPEECERRLRAVNTNVIKLNHVVHHGGLGHHVQNAHAARSLSLVGRIAAVDGASRIAMFCGGTLAEGWACYATDLAQEYGLLTPLETVAEEHSRLRQLGRAIVDIELHQGMMTFDEAVTFYADGVGMSPEAARSEASKNSMFPGAAVMYWLGTSQIHQLRAERSKALGARFSLRAFHDRLLSFGAIPVALAAKLMRADAAT
ncbi:MAG TPA: DUF885 family protein [Vicinamibacterales bacterium]